MGSLVHPFTGSSESTWRRGCCCLSSKMRSAFACAEDKSLPYDDTMQSVTCGVLLFQQSCCLYFVRGGERRREHRKSWSEGGYGRSGGRQSAPCVCG